MKRLFILALLCLVVAPVASAQQTESYSLWLGSHYTSFSDYQKKVAEFNKGSEEWLPELRLQYLAMGENNIFSIDGHYFDDENISGKVKTTIGQSLKASFQYRSLTNQSEQDLLANLVAREWLTTRPGGKILTHELLDLGADYSTRREELQSSLEARISKRNDVRFMIAHRMIMEEGSEQKVQTDHCFSCHVTSQSAKVDRRTHQLETGLKGKVSGYDLGYTFAYRQYDPRHQDTYTYYDQAKHPVSGLNGAEFGSRLVFSDTTLPYGIEPKTEKLGHKVKMSGKLGEGRVSGSLGYHVATNQNTDLETKAMSGAINYSYPISPRTRLIARVSAVRQRGDDPFIDLPSYRRGMANGPVVDFDFIRYSALDRLDGRGSLELITRLNPRTTASFIAGYSRIDRDDYADIDGNQVTNKLFGQAKLRWRKSNSLTASFKYRFDMISNPFTSSRGLFEASGREVLRTLDSTAPIMPLVFYFQREDLRYQAVSSAPTSAHQFELGVDLIASSKATIHAALKGSFDKNGDLDSLDVKHSSFMPNLNLTLMPSPQWSMNIGYTFNHTAARLPVSIALFDG